MQEAWLWLEGMPMGSSVADTWIIPGPGPAQRPWLRLPQLWISTWI